MGTWLRDPFTDYKMKSLTIGFGLLCIAIARAEVYLSANQVFCNCGEAENSFYQAFSAAEQACSGQSQEGGYGSCLAVQLGWLSDDCRTLNGEAVMASLSDTKNFTMDVWLKPSPLMLTQQLDGNGLEPTLIL